MTDPRAEGQPLRVTRRFAFSPHEVYREIRETGPVRRVTMSAAPDAWLVTDYAEARALLADPRLAKDHGRALELYPDDVNSALSSDLSHNMLQSDPPDHTRLRRLVTKAFTGKAVARLAPQVERIVDGLLDDVAARGRADLIESFALPLPIEVISELLGVPLADRAKIRDWSMPFVVGHSEGVERAGREIKAYFAELIAVKRADPGEDLLSDLVHVMVDGDRLSEAELVAMAFLLVFAGHETTANLIGNGVLALLRHPEQAAALRADPSGLPAAIEEFLRYDSPIHIATTRFTTEPVLVGDVEIPANQFVMISLLGANHDGARFADPEVLDTTRAAAGHLAFGHGIHYCVGAPLARLEARIALGALLARFEVLELDAEPDELEWRKSTFVRGLSTLPVRVR